jgi:KipI family sensor histidine kinase inhibitor
MDDVSDVSLPRVVPVGPRSCLVEVGDAVAAASLASWARARDLAVDEVVPAATTVLFDGVDPDRVLAEVRHWRPGRQDAPGRLVRVPVRYDGPDLARVADLWGCSVAEAVEIHTSLDLVAVFSGFAPGFSYLAGLPDDRAVPRLASPRARVPAGSVGIADTWTGIYPGASPGGWSIVGTTDAVLWDVRREPPALLAPGTRVRLEAVG